MTTRWNFRKLTLLSPGYAAASGAWEYEADGKFPRDWVKVMDSRNHFTGLMKCDTSFQFFGIADTTNTVHSISSFGYQQPTVIISPSYTSLYSNLRIDPKVSPRSPTVLDLSITYFATSPEDGRLGWELSYLRLDFMCIGPVQ